MNAYVHIALIILQEIANQTDTEMDDRAAALLRIAQEAVSAYEREKGQAIDPSLLRHQEPIG